MIMVKNNPKTQIPSGTLLLYKKMHSGQAFYTTGEFFVDSGKWWCVDDNSYDFDYFDAWMWLPDNPSIADKI